VKTKHITTLILLSVINVFGAGISIEMENDTFATGGRDDNYTHGTRVSYISDKTLPYICDELILSLTQLMYTPQNLTLTEPNPYDRPYAGLLEVSMGGTKYWKNPKVWHQLELSLGVIGGNSFAEETQTKIHDIIDSTTPMGWDTQVEDAFLAQVDYRIYGNIYRNNNVQFNVILANNIGTVFLDAGIGSNFILGYNIPSTIHKPISRKSSWSIYLFGEAIIKYVHNNELLQSDYTDINTEEKLYETQLGIGIDNNTVGFGYSMKWRSIEFTEQDDGKQIGSIYFKWYI